MSHAASMHRAAILQQPDSRASALGWGISILAHALAVAWLWHASLPPRADTDATPVARIEVWLIPITRRVPSPLPVPAPSAAIRRSGTTPTRAALRPTLARRVPPTSAASAAPTVTSSESKAEAIGTPSADVPTVDLAAARAAARLIAREDEKDLVALPKRKPVVDPSADHHVDDPLERARRVNCETARANSTNLLANVAMLAMDMVANAIDDSGCKW